MARLKITIEGDMTPEEMKRYIVASWQLKAELPHDVAISTVDSHDDEPAAPAPVVVEPPATTPAPVAERSLVERLSEPKMLSQLLRVFVADGVTDLGEIIAHCRTLQGQVPMLGRLGAALEDRITRTWEGMK